MEAMVQGKALGSVSYVVYKGIRPIDTRQSYRAEQEQRLIDTLTISEIFSECGDGTLITVFSSTPLRRVIVLRFQRI